MANIAANTANKRDSMIKTLVGLKGNARACIWTEPLWGIPYNLYAPYIALYMRDLGLTPAQIGYVASISLFVQMIASVLSGVLTDKLGRRRCTLIFDTISWSIPELLWAFSQNFSWFIVAALFNGLWRITMNSWGLLLVEDTDEKLIVRLFSLTQLMGLLATFFAPLSKFAIDAYGIVPTMRVLYFVTFISMTTKFIVLNFMAHETQMGKKRMEATKDQSIWQLLLGCWDVFIKIVKEKRMVLTIAITAVYQIISTLNGNFWALLVTERIGILEGNIAWFTTLKSVIMLSAIFLLVPRLRFRAFKNPMLISWAVFAIGQILLLTAPAGIMAVPMLMASVICEAIAMSVLTPMLDSLLFINADPEERARVLGLVYGTMLIIVSIFPALAGKMAQISIAMPFFINLIMFALGAVLTIGIWHTNQTE